MEDDATTTPTVSERTDAEPAGAGPADAGDGPSWWRRERLPDLVFAAIVVVGFAILVYRGRFFWFFRDDWNFITERELSRPGDLFRPHNAHWTTVGVVLFRINYALFGIRTYLPYQLLTILMHVTVVVLLRVIMRRAGVGPWTSIAFAGSFLLFGPGRENIFWGFQVAVTGSVMFVLIQLLLADHDGPIGRRDLLALGAGLLGLMSSGVAVVLVAVVGVVVLVRRGWRAAAVQTLPLAGAYLLYDTLADPASVQGSPSLEFVRHWIANGQSATFLAIGHHRVVVALLVAMLVIGIVVHVAVPQEGTTRWDGLRRIAAPLAMFAGAYGFMVVTAVGRSFTGPQGSRAGRYIYVCAALVLPLLAVAATALARRWQLVALPLCALVLVAVPANLDAFESQPFGPGYHHQREQILRTIVLLPEARQVPRDLKPIPDVYTGTGPTIGFLLHAYDSGKLVPTERPIPPQLRHELLLRLSVHQGQAPAAILDGCALETGTTVDVDLDEGDAIRFAVNIRLQRIVDGKPSGPAVEYRPAEGGELTIVLPDTQLRVGPPWGSSDPVAVCVAS